jgi:hypothetical protein
MGAIRERPGSMVVEECGFIKEDTFITFACDRDMCHVIHRPGRFDGLLDGITDQVASESQDKRGWVFLSIAIPK